MNLKKSHKFSKIYLGHKSGYFFIKIFKRFCKEDYPKNYRSIFRSMMEGYQGGEGV